MAITAPLTGTSGASTATAAFAHTFPTGWAAGDIAIALNVISINADTFSQSAGSTFTGLGSGGALQTDFSGAVLFSACIAWRVLQAGDSAPTFSVPTSSRASWCMMILRPTSGSVISLDVAAGPVFDASAGTTHAIPSATAAGSAEASVACTAAKANASGTTAITFTPPTGYTAGATGSQAGGASTISNACFLAYKIGVGSGTVSPGTDSTNVALNTASPNYQLLIKEAVAASGFTGWGIPL